MIDESIASTESRHRWPLVLFLAPVGVLFLTGYNNRADWLIFFAVGVIFVSGGLWSVWFSGIGVDTDENKSSHASTFSHLMLSFLSGYILVQTWSVALKKIWELEGVDSSLVEAEVSRLSQSLFYLTPTTGLFAFGFFYYFLNHKKLWMPLFQGTPMWTKSEAVWVLTSVCMTVLYIVIWVVSRLNENVW